jgi:hypothetical protein
VGQTVSKAGSLVTGFALPLAAIVLLHASAAQVALLSAAGIVPGLVLGLVAGVWADRARRRPLMLAADIARALVVGSVPVAALLGRLRMEQLYMVALASSALSVVFEVAYPAYLASLCGLSSLAGADPDTRTMADGHPDSTSRRRRRNGRGEGQEGRAE